MRFLVAISALLAGCQANPVPAVVKIPVQVPCEVAMPKRPAWATESLARDAGIYDRVKALLAEREQRIGYETELEAAVGACGKP